jgi:hypothetical protein
LGFSLSLQVRHWPVPLQRLGRSFPRSTLAPEPGSRRLCAGCHLGSKQVSPRLVPSTKPSSVSTSLIGVSTRSSTVYLIRLPGSYLTPSHGRLFRNAHHPGRCAGAAHGGLEPPPARRPRGTYPHRQRSITSGCPIYIGSTLHVRGASFALLQQEGGFCARPIFLPLAWPSARSVGGQASLQSFTWTPNSCPNSGLDRLDSSAPV